MVVMWSVGPKQAQVVNEPMRKSPVTPCLVRLGRPFRKDNPLEQDSVRLVRRWFHKDNFLETCSVRLVRLGGWLRKDNLPQNYSV